MSTQQEESVNRRSQQLRARLSPRLLSRPQQASAEPSGTCLPPISKLVIGTSKPLHAHPTPPTPTKPQQGAARSSHFCLPPIWNAVKQRLKNIRPGPAWPPFSDIPHPFVGIFHDTIFFPQHDEGMTCTTLNLIGQCSLPLLVGLSGHQSPPPKWQIQDSLRSGYAFAILSAKHSKSLRTPWSG